MQVLLLSLSLSVSLFAFLWDPLVTATPLRTAKDGNLTEGQKFTGPDLTEKRLIKNDETDFDGNKELLEDVDFEDDDDDDFDEPIYLFGSSDQNVNSIRHLHQRKGEILVPCFGMWWPVGGTTYDYVEDYDGGDYRRRRRRSRKKKKAARAKKKKS